MPLRIIIILLFIAFVVASTHAQLSNLHTKKIAAHGTVLLDTKSIVPGTISMENIDTSFYSLDWPNAILSWKKLIIADSILITYRSFQQKLNAVFRLYEYDSIKNNFALNKQTIESKSKDDNSIINFGKLNYSGSIGRNLTIGNNQDAVVNAQMNLQLNGYIGDSILLSAALTDNNIPIQPDGTTQQLNEFDQVLLSFSKPSWKIDLGDIDLRQNQNYFLNVILLYLLNLYLNDIIKI